MSYGLLTLFVSTLYPFGTDTHHRYSCYGINMKYSWLRVVVSIYRNVLVRCNHHGVAGTARMIQDVQVSLLSVFMKLSMDSYTK